MSTHALGGIGMPVLVDPHLRARLDKVAEAVGRTASELANAVLRDFLDENERELAALDAGIEQADAGELLDYDEVKADVLRKLSASGRGRSRAGA